MAEPTDTIAGYGPALLVPGDDNVNIGSAGGTVTAGAGVAFGAAPFITDPVPAQASIELTHGDGSTAITKSPSPLNGGDWTLGLFFQTTQTTPFVLVEHINGLQAVRISGDGATSIVFEAYDDNGDLDYVYTHMDPLNDGLMHLVMLVGYIDVATDVAAVVDATMVSYEDRLGTGTYSSGGTISFGAPVDDSLAFEGFVCDLFVKTDTFLDGGQLTAIWDATQAPAPPTIDIDTFIGSFTGPIEVFDPMSQTVDIATDIGSFSGLIEATVVYLPIDVPSIDGAVIPAGPATVALFSTATNQDIVVPSIDGAAPLPGAIVEHFPIVIPEFQPDVYAHLYSAAGTLLSTLDNASSVKWQDPLNDVGSGSFQLPLDDPDATLIRASTEVRCFMYGLLVYSWFVEKDPQLITTEPGEEAALSVSAEGRGRVSVFDRARVFPYKGTDAQVMSQHRLFSFASPEFPNAATWPAASVGLRQDVIDPIRKAVIEYTTVSDITDVPDAVDLVDAPAPLGWLVPEAYWIWGSPDTLQVGFCYFRSTFTLVTATAVTIAATADNYWTLYLDGNPILGDQGEGIGWLEHKRVELTLPAGTYYLAAVVENIPLPGMPPENNPAGFLAAVYTVDNDGKLVATIKVSDGSWTALGYPSVVPGWTPGQIMLRCMSEAQTRGWQTDFAPGFTEWADSSGQPWIGSMGGGSFVPGFSIPIGGSVLDVLNQLVEQGWVDYRVTAGGKVLQMFSQGNGNQDSGIILNADGNQLTQNIVSQSFEPQTPPTTILLVKWSSGFFIVGNAPAQADWGVWEGFVTIDATTEIEARRQAGLVLNEVSNPQWAIVIETDPAVRDNGGDEDRPYISYAVGDQLTIPNHHGIATLFRLLSISVDQTQMGRPTIALEFNRRLQERERQQFELLQTLGRGVVGPTKVRNAMNQTTSTAHG